MLRYTEQRKESIDYLRAYSMTVDAYKRGKRLLFENKVVVYRRKCWQPCALLGQI